MTFPFRCIRTFLFLAVLGGGPLYGQGWEGVEGILGRPGVADGETISFEFPRTDLNVLVQGVPLESRGMLVSQVSFFPEGREARLETAMLLLESETTKALAQAARNGLRVISLDEPFLDASPQVRCLRLTGQGSRKSLAWAVKLVLDSTGTPMVPETPISRPTPKKDPWVDVRKVFGAGSVVGEALLYTWAKDPKDEDHVKGDLRIILQSEGNDLALWGEVRTTSTGSDLWITQLLAKGYQVTAVTRGADDEPMVWVDFWCLNDEKKAINNLATLLEDSGSSSGTSEP